MAKVLPKLLLVLIAPLLLSSCLAAAVVGTGVAVVRGAADVTGDVVGAAIPDGDDDDDKKDKDD
jgi:hypothetical protein